MTLTGKRVGDPTVNELRCLKYSCNGIFFKLSFEDEYKVLPQQPQAVVSYHPEKLYRERLPISLSKFEDLQELKLVLPAEAHQFYDTLPHDTKIQSKEVTVPHNTRKNVIKRNVRVQKAIPLKKIVKCKKPVQSKD